MQYGRAMVPAHRDGGGSLPPPDRAASGADRPWVLVATAHPAKFNEVVEPIIGKAVAVPASSGPAAAICRGTSLDLPPTLAAVAAALE